MATGIVSIATALTGFAWLSLALLALNLAVFAALWGLLLWRVCRVPASVVADLHDHRRAPSSLAVVAATCVVGNELALSGGAPWIAAGLWVAACALWACLLYGFFALMTIRPAKPPLESGVDGSWLLVVVATEALAILTTHTAFAPAPAVALASLCLFLLGGAFYALLLIAIVYRWLFLPMRPDELTPAYWINMGAAAIATLAGTRLLPELGADPALLPVRDVVFGATLLFWSIASWWIPLLAALTLWRHLSGARLVYRLDNWSMVFPLGMYATASWRLSQAFDLPFVAVIPHVFVWVALAAWSLTFAGMLRAGWRDWPMRRSSP
jgi:tellurite resistance protein TehA-like permease